MIIKIDFLELRLHFLILDYTTLNCTPSKKHCRKLGMQSSERPTKIKTFPEVFHRVKSKVS
jgi:hypothetical protein